MGSKTKYSVDFDIGESPDIKVISHSQMQGHLETSKSGVLLEYVDAKLLLNSMLVEFGYDKNKLPIELSVLELKLKYRATIYMSQIIPKGSKCWKEVIAHASEHHDINVKGLKGIASKAADILQKHAEGLVSGYKGDFAKLEKAAGTSVMKEFAKKVAGKIQDELFIPILKKSVAIDTDANYKPLDLVCSEHYM